MMRKPIFAANWKMNKGLKEVAPFIEILGSSGGRYETVIAPQAIHLPRLVEAAKGKAVLAAAQNCGTAKSGAFTGELSPFSLKELGCEWVILGHSERRHVYKEDNALVAARTEAAWNEGLTVILCVGEKIDERKSGKTFDVIAGQLAFLKGLPKVNASNLTIAYEPVWAIGTGEVATPGQAEEAHLYIRGWLEKNLDAERAKTIRILYGGSVKPDNAASLMVQPDVDGFLVGGASLDATIFAEVIKRGLESRA